MRGQHVPEPLTREIEIQTMYRESEVQTDAFTPSVRVRNGANPEVLLLQQVRVQNDLLPAHVGTIELIDKIRRRAAVEASGSLKALRELELIEAEEKEAEMDNALNQKLEDMRAALEAREAEREHVSQQRVLHMKQKLREEAQESRASLSKSRTKTLRKITKQLSTTMATSAPTQRSQKSAVDTASGEKPSIIDAYAQPTVHVRKVSHLDLDDLALEQSIKGSQRLMDMAVHARGQLGGDGFRKVKEDWANKREAARTRKDRIADSHVDYVQAKIDMAHTLSNGGSVMDASASGSSALTAATNGASGAGPSEKLMRAASTDSSMSASLAPEAQSLKRLTLDLEKTRTMPLPDKSKPTIDEVLSRYKATPRVVRPPTPSLDGPRDEEDPEHQEREQRQRELEQQRQLQQQLLADPKLAFVDPMEEEPELAIILLQRLLRGRAAQMVYYEGKERRLDLIEELVMVEEAKREERRDAHQEKSAHVDAVVSAALDGMQGLLVGDGVADYLEKELTRQEEIKRIEELERRAKKTRYEREAAETKRRHQEHDLRTREDVQFRQAERVLREAASAFVRGAMHGAVSSMSHRAAEEELSCRRVAIDHVVAAAEETEEEDDAILVFDIMSRIVVPEVERFVNHTRV
jgi:hypothetical protein